MAEVRLRNLTKSFGMQPALLGLNLEVRSGEFLVIVGPSGCGKTTILRLIAGLEQPGAGTITLDEREVSRIPPWKRQVAMVFQNQALYPHLTVRDNLGFGLRRLAWSRNQRRERIDQTAELLGITSLLPRRAADLSGGERQRVAVGRAIARPAALYLFDEPLSALDPPERETLRSELATLQQTLKATFLYVTHDQLEAMSLGHRLAVLRQGQLQQLGEPLTLYQNPANRFVAEFLGSPRLELGVARVESRGDLMLLCEPGLRIELPTCWSRTLKSFAGRDILWGVRAEEVSCRPEMAWRVDESGERKGSPIAGNSAPISLRASQVQRVEHRGYETLVTALVGTGTRRQTARVSGIPPKVGDRVCFVLDVSRLLIFDSTTGEAISPPKDDVSFPIST